MASISVIRKVYKCGGGYYVNVPTIFLRALGLSLGDKVEVIFDEDKIIVRPLKEVNDSEQ